MLPILMAGLVVVGIPTLYFAVKSRELRKFLAGAFFVSAGMQAYFWLAGVEVLAPANTGAIVAFGDSITDGFTTTPNAHRAWPALLAARLQRNAATARWGVVNVGIAGNRVRRAFSNNDGLTG